MAVIGAGRMGRWLARFAKENLGEVMVVDAVPAKAQRVARELGIPHATAGRAAAWADIVLVAIPIPKTPEVLAALARVMRAGALLADVCSVKRDVVKKMAEITRPVELVSIHPLFGQGAKTIRGKDIVVVPVRPGKNYRLLKKRLIKLGARVAEMGAEEHDRAMAAVQCLSHFILMVYLSVYLSLRKSLKKDLRTPFSHSLKELSKAVLAGDAGLLEELQLKNDYAGLVRREVLKACERLDRCFAAGRCKELRNLFALGEKIFGKEDVEKAYESLYSHFEGEKE